MTDVDNFNNSVEIHELPNPSEIIGQIEESGFERVTMTDALNLRDLNEFGLNRYLLAEMDRTIYFGQMDAEHEGLIRHASVIYIHGGEEQTATRSFGAITRTMFKNLSKEGTIFAGELIVDLCPTIRDVGGSSGVDSRLIQKKTVQGARVLGYKCTSHYVTNSSRKKDIQQGFISQFTSYSGVHSINVERTQEALKERIEYILRDISKRLSTH